ncbi:MAG: hypothetical protein C5B48_15710 [Candidatus Rokuibacteriota bacterium]|nr:MAG: hypothetical protein C5B48_15710 [Candidatus Rokubacteria bacterium]
MLMGTFGASPFIESFTLSGELLASLPAVLSLFAFTGYMRGGGRRWLVLAGVLSGCAVMVRQSAFDASLAAVAYLLITERRRALPAVALLLGGVALPIAAGALAASNVGQWWGAVVAYRWRGDSILTGSLAHRLGLFWSSVPPATYALGLLALLTALGWRRAPLIARLWLGAAAVGVLAGGNFHYHYYLQLVPPLCVLGGVGVAWLREERRLAAAGAAAAVAVATIALTAPLWLDSGNAQAREIWPHDPHLVHDRAVASYVRAHTSPRDKVLVLWAAASIYYLADREPAVRYLWFRNLQLLPHAVEELRRALSAGEPKLVVLVQQPDRLDETGATRRILRERYQRVALVGGVPILARRR